MDRVEVPDRLERHRETHVERATTAETCAACHGPIAVGEMVARRAEARISARPGAAQNPPRLPWHGPYHVVSVQWSVFSARFPQLREPTSILLACLRGCHGAKSASAVDCLEDENHAGLMPMGPIPALAATS
jgi:hypothetical protein